MMEQNCANSDEQTSIFELMFSSTLQDASKQPNAFAHGDGVRGEFQPSNWRQEQGDESHYCGVAASGSNSANYCASVKEYVASKHWPNYGNKH
jgi:hypothetical protein